MGMYEMATVFWGGVAGIGLGAALVAHAAQTARAAYSRARELPAEPVSLDRVESFVPSA